MNPILTIAIPTFNRNQKLRENIEILLGQIDSRIKLLILDNASDLPVSDDLIPLFEKFQDLNYRIVRHRHNVGMSENILRCFELCETEWLWIKGDDDKALPNSCEKILNEINLHNPNLALAFQLHTLPPHTCREVNNHFRFFKSEHLLESTIFLSSTLYKTLAMQPYIADAHSYCSTFAPHTALLLKALEFSESPAMICSSEQIVSWKSAPVDEQYSLFYGIVLADLLDLVAENARLDAKRELLRCITPIRRLFLHSIRDLHEGQDRFSVCQFSYKYIRIVAMLHSYIYGILIWLFWNSIFFMTSRIPHITYKLLDRIYTIVRGRTLRQSLQSNRITRNVMTRLKEQ